MKPWVTLLAAAGLVLGLGVESADAQRAGEKQREQERQAAKAARDLTPEKKKERGKAEAPAAAQAQGLACTITDAQLVTEGKQNKEDVKVYEVACSEGLGYLIVQKASAPATIDCVASITAANQAKAEGRAPDVTCSLPSNVDIKRQLQPLVTASGARCTVTDGLWIGMSATTKLSRYEVGCTEGMGYLVDRPAGPGAKPAVIDCLSAQQSNYDCKLTPKAQRLGTVTALVAKSGKSCTVTDARVMGTDSRGSIFYEAACGSQPGLIIEADNTGAVKRAVDCLQGAKIGGGCKLSDTSVAANAKRDQYVAMLKTRGVPCQATDFRLIGTDTRNNREVVEFACSDRPSGLVIFVPAAANGKFEAMDCITSTLYAARCELTPRTALHTVLANAITAGGKACQVSDFRVLGPSAEPDGEVLEVACGAGEPGYITDVPASRVKYRRAQTCAVSASRGGDRCTLAGNAGK